MQYGRVVNLSEPVDGVTQIIKFSGKEIDL